jgi:C-terminal processing protease CtpA/Prc
VIRRTAELVRDIYVHPTEGREIHDGLLRFLREGRFDGEMTDSEFAAKQTEYLYFFSRDKHMRVIFDPRRARELDKREKLSEKAKKEIEKGRTEQAAKENFGFKKVEILEGNIGYMDFHIFDKSEPALETGAAAMRFLSQTDAVILDLRANRGGQANMVRLIASCFIEGRVLLNTIIDRDGKIREEIWTLPEGSGPAMHDRDLYVLTGIRTASAAESFIYIMKNLKRAVIVGERTAGAANPGGFHHAGGGFLVFIPSGQPVSPVTGTNWEGVGVEPDVLVPEGQALRKAHSLALEKLKKTIKSSENRYDLKKFVKMKQ